MLLKILNSKRTRDYLIQMCGKKYVVWRWAKHSNKFIPRRNRSWGDRDYGEYTYGVNACINPTDWMWIGRSRSGPLHKIVLTEEQAKRCVVAEQNFMPSMKDLADYVRETGGRMNGCYDRYCAERYPKSFISLIEYDGQHNLPEVLIPFEVDAYPQRLKTIWLNFKAKYLNPELRKIPPTLSK